MCRPARDAVAVAIFAKAPIPGFAKTRLIPALGPEGAAALQTRLIAHAAATAAAAAIGKITLWGAPDDSHPVFQSAKIRHGTALARQPPGDLGARMFAAFAAAGGPLLAIGTDCPALTPGHLRACAEVLRDGLDAVAIPAQDGGYVLLGLRRPEARLFIDMPWGTPKVMGETRSRFARLALAWREPARLWDLDRPEDLARLAETGLDRGCGEPGK